MNTQQDSRSGAAADSGIPGIPDGWTEGMELFAEAGTGDAAMPEEDAEVAALFPEGEAEDAALFDETAFDTENEETAFGTERDEPAFGAENGETAFGAENGEPASGAENGETAAETGSKEASGSMEAADSAAEDGDAEALLLAQLMDGQAGDGPDGAGTGVPVEGERADARDSGIGQGEPNAAETERGHGGAVPSERGGAEPENARTAEGQASAEAGPATEGQTQTEPSQTVPVQARAAEGQGPAARPDAASPVRESGVSDQKTPVSLRPPRDLRGEVAQLRTLYPELRRLPDQVAQAVSRGVPLVTAYLAYQDAERSKTVALLRQENRILRQNADSASRAPVRGAGRGGAASGGKSLFEQGFDAGMHW